jgi:hypothetical protein
MSKNIVLSLGYADYALGDSSGCQGFEFSEPHPYVYVSAFDLDELYQPLLIEWCEYEEFEAKVKRIKMMLDECLRQARMRLSHAPEDKGGPGSRPPPN